MKRLNFLIAVLIVFLAYAKSSGQVLFLTKNDLAKYRVSSITNLKSTPIGACTCINLDSCAQIFKMNNGKLIQEDYFNDTSMKFSNRFIYQKGKLIGYNIEMGPSQEQHFVKYHYRNSKLISSYQVNSHYDLDDKGTYTSNDDFEDFREYYYDNQNKLTRTLFYEVEGKRHKETGIRYYLYIDGKLTGYFPAKDGNSITTSPPDSIYYDKKLIELRRVGFKSFQKKYFSKAVYNKVMDDCYLQLHRNELFINDKPINLFLDNINKKDATYLVFEVSDNYFLFYKLID